MRRLRISNGRTLVRLPGVVSFYMEYGEKFRISKAVMPDVPFGFRRSKWSLSLGARAVYRDRRGRRSLQLREYKDHWTVQLDRFNPEAGKREFVGHALTDALHVTLFGAAGILLGAGLLSGAARAR
ncbi:MAG: hypothetical protein O7H41_17590 [Planctomycetota bacterium]|nr:hypothetical protein [Planctomycetota bacterium]